MTEMETDKQIEWFSRHVPSHLKGIVSPDCPELGLGNGGHGEEIAVGYRLKCRCGNKEFEVSAYLWRSVSLISPIRANCVRCGENIVVFDSDIHGYDPVACEMSSSVHGEREDEATVQYISSASEPKTVDIITYYPSDLFNQDFDDFSDRRNDLFTWIRIVVGEEINADYPALDFECA